MHFKGLFLRSRYRMEGCFFGMVKFQILFGVLEIPDMFFFFVFVFFFFWGGGGER